MDGQVEGVVPPYGQAAESVVDRQRELHEGARAVGHDGPWWPELPDLRVGENTRFIVEEEHPGETIVVGGQAGPDQQERHHPWGDRGGSSLRCHTGSGRTGLRGREDRGRAPSRLIVLLRLRSGCSAALHRGPATRSVSEKSW